MTFEPDTGLLSDVMDRVIPPVDDLPGAGGMGLAAEVIDRSRSDPRFWYALQTVLEALPAADDFSERNADARDAAIGRVESAHPHEFGLWLDAVYTIYYMQPKVHQRIGWHGRSPQPDGNQMPPWDESVLEKVRRREPFWRKV